LTKLLIVVILLTERRMTMGNWKRKLRTWRAEHRGRMVVIEERKKPSLLGKAKQSGGQPFQLKLRREDGGWAPKGGAKTLEEAKKKGDRILLMS
jgi:hypothetical protein